MKPGEALRTYQRQWYANRKATFFAGKTCSQCGSTERLELHHQDPTAKASHNIWSWSQAKREAEIAKCVVLCHRCHNRRTIAQHRFRQTKLLTVEQCQAVFDALEAGETKASIARRFEISTKTIWRLLDGIDEGYR